MSREIRVLESVIAELSKPPVTAPPVEPPPPEPRDNKSAKGKRNKGKVCTVPVTLQVKIHQFYLLLTKFPSTCKTAFNSSQNYLSNGVLRSVISFGPKLSTKSVSCLPAEQTLEYM